MTHDGAESRTKGKSNEAAMTAAARRQLRQGWLRMRPTPFMARLPLTSATGGAAFVPTRVSKLRTHGQTEQVRERGQIGAKLP